MKYCVNPEKSPVQGQSYTVSTTCVFLPFV